MALYMAALPASTPIMLSSERRDKGSLTGSVMTDSQTRVRFDPHGFIGLSWYSPVPSRLFRRFTGAIHASGVGIKAAAAGRRNAGAQNRFVKLWRAAITR